MGRRPSWSLQGKVGLEAGVQFCMIPCIQAGRAYRDSVLTNKHRNSPLEASPPQVIPHVIWDSHKALVELAERGAVAFAVIVS